MNSIFKFLKNLGWQKIAGLILLLTIVVIGFTLLINKVVAPSYSLLFAELDLKDSSEIIAELDIQNIPYRTTNDGSKILVPNTEVAKLRMMLAQKGLPNSGSVVGYEIFDTKDAFGTSQFVQNINLVRALEGELSRTISTFKNIESARVHLLLPKKEVFAKDNTEPKASVFLKMRGKNQLNKEEIKAVAYLIVTAVPGLDMDSVTIVDSFGRTLKVSRASKDDGTAIVASIDDFKVAMEVRLRNMIEDLLEQSLGMGSIKAEVSADINFDKIVTNTETYDPDGQVLRSKHSVLETQTATDSRSNQNVTIANNLPNNAAGGGVNNSNTNINKNDEITNFEISKTIKSHVSQTGTIKKLSIAVLVDGIYEKQEDGSFKYTARTDEELQKITALVKSAVGFDESRQDKIEIVNMQFNRDLSVMKEENFQDWFKGELNSITQRIIIAIIVILFILFVLRPIIKKVVEAAQDNQIKVEDIDDIVKQQIESAKQSTISKSVNEINMDDIDTSVKNNAYKIINEIAGKYPDELVTILRRWMNENK